MFTPAAASRLWQVAHRSIAGCVIACALAASAVAGPATNVTLATTNSPGSVPGAPSAYAPSIETPSGAAPAAAAPIAGDLALIQRLDGAGPLIVAGERLKLSLLRRFYAGHNDQLLWPTHEPQAHALWERVLHADSHGLDPNTFHADAVAKAASLTPVDRDLLMSDAFLRYAEALAQGAYPVEQRTDDEDLTPGPVDAVTALDAAIAAPDPAKAIDALAPQTAAYAALRRAYASYRAIAQAGGWPSLDEPRRRGERVAENQIGLLQQRLAKEGYLPAGYNSNVDDAATEQALRTFQTRHGLAPDGRLTRATVAALNVPAAERARQIAVNLERLRWLPRPLPADRVWVNTAAEELQLFRDNRPIFSARVVTGQVTKQTPEFQSEITGVLFNPPWNVPHSIAVREILPRLREDPDYMRQHHMVWRANGAIQQLAGPYSALGRVKFEMADRYDVYLHDTPERYLFARAYRRVSHGCVRVQHPRQLASLLLGDSPETIARNIAVGYTHEQRLAAPLPVFVVYQTAFADPDGAIEFQPDAYGRDDEVWQFLNRSLQSPVAQESSERQRKG